MPAPTRAKAEAGRAWKVIFFAALRRQRDASGFSRLPNATSAPASSSSTFANTRPAPPPAPPAPPPPSPSTPPPPPPPPPAPDPFRHAAVQQNIAHLDQFDRRL